MSADRPAAPLPIDPAQISDGDSLAKAIVEEVELTDYDSTWPLLFERERSRLDALAHGALVKIEHFGSTAVPGLAAKPVIDLLGAVAAMDHADLLVPLLCANGYTTSAEFNQTLPDRRWLMRHQNGHRTHHLHLVVLDGREWKARLAFRDALRGDPAFRARYMALKTTLAAAHRADRERYTDGKSAFVKEALARLGVAN